MKAVSSTDSARTGMGTQNLSVRRPMIQGTITNSANPLDLAINGAGFFRLQKSATDQTISYTRHGQYHLDDQGYIVNASGNNLTGYAITNGITNRATMVPVQLDIKQQISCSYTAARSLQPLG